MQQNQTAEELLTDALVSIVYAGIKRKQDKDYDKLGALYTEVVRCIQQAIAIERKK